MCFKALRQFRLESLLAHSNMASNMMSEEKEG
jgi:hypothetical protein